MPRALVTGGTGFVGSFVVEGLLKSGYAVRAMVRDPERIRWLKGLPIELSVGTLIEPSTFSAAVSECDVVIHCAGLTKARRDSDFFAVNAVGTGNLALAARNAGVKRFVLCSSQAAAGPAGKGVAAREDDTPQPVSAYGRSKLEGERALKEVSGDMEWVVLRPPSVMGPRDEQFVMLFRAACRYGIAPAFGTGHQQYNFVCVHDLVRALIQAASEERGIQEVYFVAHPEPIALADAARAIGAIVSRKMHVLRLGRPMLSVIGYLSETAAALQNRPALLNRAKIDEILSPGWICSVDKIKRAWGFEAEWSLERTVRMTYEAYREQHWL